MLSKTDHDYGTPASASTQLVSVDIDGRACQVPAGSSILRAAAEAGIGVPKLCATESLEPFGSRDSDPADCVWWKSTACGAIRPPAPRRSPRA